MNERYSQAQEVDNIQRKITDCIGEWKMKMAEVKESRRAKVCLLRVVESGLSATPAWGGVAFSGPISLSEELEPNFQINEQATEGFKLTNHML